MTVKEIFEELENTDGIGDDIWIVASAVGFRASRLWSGWFARASVRFRSIWQALNSFATPSTDSASQHAAAGTLNSDLAPPSM